MAIVRPSWKNRGPMYTEYGITVRCVRKDQTAAVSIRRPTYSLSHTHTLEPHPSLPD